MKILYLYHESIENIIKLINSGKNPTDRLYGLIELKDLGYNVKYSVLRPDGYLSKLILYFNSRFYLNIVDLKKLLYVLKFDTIIVKDQFSTLLTIVCRIYRKKIIYLDALFRAPKNKLRRIVYKINIKYASGIIVYSKFQKKYWSKLLNISENKFIMIPYTIDVNFYKSKHSVMNTNEKYILSIGRDLARDFKTLVNAVSGLGVNLKIITLPYLLKGIKLDEEWIEILEYISYEKLFQLYANALFVVIPLKKFSFEYPSGVRGLLEALMLDKYVITSYSIILSEYIQNRNGVIYVEPENIDDLREKIISLLEHKKFNLKPEGINKKIIETNYNMEILVKSIEKYL